VQGTLHLTVLLLLQISSVVVNSATRYFKNNARKNVFSKKASR
jgi:hypothetical protein